MLYGNNTKNKTGDLDPFNKKRLAEEAKKDKEKQLELQRQQERNKLQLQIDNLKREIDRLVLEVSTREKILSETKLKLGQAERDVFLTAGEIKKEEGGIGYLDDSINAGENRLTNIEAELEKATSDTEISERESTVLKTKYNSVKMSLVDLETKIKNFEDEISRMRAEADILKREIAKQEAEIKVKNDEIEKKKQKIRSIDAELKQDVNKKVKVVRTAQDKGKKIEKEKQDLNMRKRLIEQLKREEQMALQTVTRLNRDKASKEKEMEDLKRKRDGIK
jgi:predicted  nucleic acid-binding Zn-ribbon protein